jgi:lipopolysaccharide transport system ATP-binding protein
MSPSNVAISIRNLSKSFVIRHEAKYTTLAEKLVARLRHPLARNNRETFEALKDISFDVNKGDVLGIIGRNGAGKSTLLKILSRITEPTRGCIEIRGRIGSLLEVGTGFHQELTGRENVFLNGAILGMRRKEIQKHFDAIVDFAGVEKFLDTPVKRYSSGMCVRLAFAVAAHLNPEILIVDEVLAVGDAEFQQKCLGKMKDVASGGRTVLFVSHNMQAINLLCGKGVLLQEGRVACIGTAREAVEQYNRSFAVTAQRGSDHRHRRGSGEYRFAWVRPARAVFDPGEMIRVDFSVKKCLGPIGRMYFSAHVIDDFGVIVAHCDSRLVGAWADDAPEVSGTFELNTPWLKPGVYRLDFYIISADGAVDRFESACKLSVSSQLPYPHTAPPGCAERGPVLSDFSWRMHSSAASVSGDVEKVVDQGLADQPSTRAALIGKV